MNNVPAGSRSEGWRMNMPFGRSYRLVARGEAGLACDENGVMLGAVELAHIRIDDQGARRCTIRPSAEVRDILEAAYGPQPEAVVLRLHKGLQRVASSIEGGDLGRAGVEALLLGLPDLTPGVMTKLAKIARAEEAGAAWKDEPRIPAGRSGGGQWTTDSAGASALQTKPPRHAPPIDNGHREHPTLQLDDGVYRPGNNDPFLIQAGGTEEEEPPRIGSNGPPDDFTSLTEVFPGLKDNPGLAIPLAPIDGFLGVSASADSANLAATRMQYRMLIAEIKTLDPGFVDSELLPQGGIAGLSWQGRNNLIAGLRMQRAATLYRFNGDARLLQVETLRFLQDAVDDAYAEGEKEYSAGRLTPRLSREEAIGKYVDRLVRINLGAFFNTYGVWYGPGENITVNNRDYDTSSPAKTYKVPDARVGDISFDWTLTLKTMLNEQIRGFFAADSRPIGVVIVRPSQLGAGSTYLIPRPATLRPRR